MPSIKTLYIIFKLLPKLYKNTKYWVYLAIIIISKNTIFCRMYYLVNTLRGIYISSFYLIFNILLIVIYMFILI